MGAYPKSSVIASYTLKGELVGIYQSAKEASISLGVFNRSVDKAIRQSSSLKGLIFKRYESIDNVEKKISPYQKGRINQEKVKVAKVDEEGKILSIYPSIKSASKENDISPKQIRECLKGHQHKAGGHYWKRID